MALHRGDFFVGCFSTDSLMNGYGPLELLGLRLHCTRIFVVIFTIKEGGGGKTAERDLRHLNTTAKTVHKPIHFQTFFKYVIGILHLNSRGFKSHES